MYHNTCIVIFVLMFFERHTFLDLFANGGRNIWRVTVKWT